MRRVRGARSIATGLFFLLGGAAPAAAQSADNRPCRADYAIRARYDAEERKITGTEIIQWKNETADDVPDLWFHLYWNAFANTESTHLHESGGELRGVMLEDEWGWQRITALRVGGTDLLPDLRWRSPDDARTEDRTVFSVKLPEAVHAGETIAIGVEWEAKIPRLRRRVGYKDDFLFMAHWFPKLGVYEFGNGWNCHQFHATTEFFSDYGTYDVELDLPREYDGKIGASGVLAAPMEVSGDRVKARFTAPSEADQRRPDHLGLLPLVHEFAWTADPDFKVYEATFVYDEWAARFPEEVERTALALKRSPEELRLRDVRVSVFLHPDHFSQGARHFDATCTALFFYGLWFGGYPYEHITVVDPVWGGGAAGGMEYPTLFTAGSRMFTWPGMFSPESVTVHECGHQFWYGLVGNNEFEAAWLDEGFNTYTQNEALLRRYGSSHSSTDFSRLPFDGTAMVNDPGGAGLGAWLALEKWSLPRGIVLEPVHESGLLKFWKSQPLLTFARERNDPRWSARNGYLADPDSDPVDTPAWKYVDRESYRQNSYRRTGVALASLEGLIGRDRFLRGMRRYSERWRYGHPYPQDFFDSFNAGSGVDMSWYFDQAFRSTATVDWVVEVSQKKKKAPIGWYQNAHGEFEKRDAPDKAAKEGEERDGDEPESKDSEAQDGESASGSGGEATKLGYDIDVVVRRKGTLILPLAIELTYEGGEKETFVWTRDAQERSTWWKPLEDRASSPKEIVSAVLDPERAYLFDTDMSNNQWFKEEDRVAPLRWAERVFTQYSHVLHWFGGLGG